MLPVVITKPICVANLAQVNWCFKMGKSKRKASTTDSSTDVAKRVFLIRSRAPTPPRRLHAGAASILNTIFGEGTLKTSTDTSTDTGEDKTSPWSFKDVPLPFPDRTQLQPWRPSFDKGPFSRASQGPDVHPLFDAKSIYMD